jgi:hypothetical protein
VANTQDDQERLQELIEQFNRNALHDKLTSYEVVELRALIPQIKEVLESQRRLKWLFKLLGMFLLAAPAVAAVAQGFSKLVEWVQHK